MTPKLKITPEFSRPLLVDRVPRKGSHEVFAAEPAECLALAKRFDLPALHSVKAHLIATPWRGGGIKVTGKVDADLEQVSVVSLEGFRSGISFEVERYFLPEKMIVDAVADDVDPIENGEIDLGEVIAEEMGLVLEPYPRKPGESFEAVIEDDGAVSEAQVSPFAKLQKIAENDN
jgi:uncharacterized metal-binding protein YceD (DUF177 family)